MRLLMLDNEFPPLGGGTGVVNYYLLKEFAACEEVWVDLITSSRTRGQFEEERFAERIMIYKVPVDNRNIHHSTNPELLRYAWRAFHVSRQLLRRQRYDLSFAFAGVPAGAISYLLKVLNRLPYLVSLQGPDVPGFEARYNYLYPFLKPLLRTVWKNASAVTAISHEHQRLAHQTLALDIPIIPNGVDTNAFHPAANRIGPINILCVGRLIQRKGQHHLLQAFAAVCRRVTTVSLQLTLAGTGDAEADLRNLANQLGLAGRVNFAGVIAREKMPEVYRQADIFVLPSQSEGMSIALLEAMASGLPVIVTDTGGTAELVTAGQNGLVVPWADVTGLAAALERLVCDRALRLQWGAASRTQALRFAWNAIAAMHLNLCQAVLSGGQEGR